MTKKEWVQMAGRYLESNSSNIKLVADQVFSKEPKPIEWSIISNVYHYAPFSLALVNKPRVNQQIKQVIHFTMSPCTSARTAVSFALMKDGTVQVARHRKGKCPFIIY